MKSHNKPTIKYNKLNKNNNYLNAKLLASKVQVYNHLLSGKLGEQASIISSRASVIASSEDRLSLSLSELVMNDLSTVLHLSPVTRCADWKAVVTALFTFKMPNS